MLPGLSGVDVLRQRRAEDYTAAVLIVSALADEDDRLLGLELLGADDYLVKPVSPREAVERVQAPLRRAERLGAQPLVPPPTRVRSSDPGPRCVAQPSPSDRSQRGWQRWGG